VNIIVCIKQVPGTSEVEIDETTGNLIREGIDTKMNPYDLYAIETAMKIKEKNSANINVISMGPPQANDVIKEAYMMGVDDGYLEMDMPETVEIQEVELPCLITVEKDIYQPRLPSFKLKLATAKRKIKNISFNDLDDDNPENFGLDGSPTQVLDVFPPKSDRINEKWEGTGKELGERISNKLKKLKFV
jgi:electron transfer flavoprotein alpha/beta subunit